MIRSVSGLGACLAVACAAAPSFGAFVVVGSLQTEQGDPSDWSPETSSLIMSESGGMHSVTAVGLSAGAPFEFKILNDQGDPPASWGDPEVTPNNLRLYGDLDGSVSITADANTLNNQGNPVVWANFDGAPLQVVGNFMDEAGGAGDWNPADPAFTMTSLGGGYYTFAAVISDAGSYEFKVTDGTGWDYQIGTDGFGNNANTFAFATTIPNEPVVLFLDLANGQLGVVPEPASLALLGLGGLAMLRRRG